MLNATITGAPRGYIDGLTLSTAGGSNLFAVANGEAADSAANAQIVMTSSPAFNKTTSPWGAGTGNGALDAGSIGTNSWYHVYLIRRPDTGAVDVMVSLSVSGPSLPANYTQYRRIGALLTGGSSNWTAFSQYGDEFLWSVPPSNANPQATSTTAANLALTVPSGLKVTANFGIELYQGSGSTGLVFTAVYPPDTNAPALNTSGLASNLASAPGIQQFRIRTDTGGNVKIASSTNTGNLYVSTFGWIDSRGRDN